MLASQSNANKLIKMNRLQIVKAGCETCVTPCTTFSVDQEDDGWFTLVCDGTPVPITMSLPTESLIDRIRTFNSNRQRRERMAEIIAGLPICEGPIEGECPYGNPVRWLDQTMVSLAEMTKETLPGLITPLES